LWQQLPTGPNAAKFRRQHPIGPNIVGLRCLSARLVVEVDGIVHDMDDRPQRDETRTRFLKEDGFRVLRIAVQGVIADAVGTAEAIAARAAIPHYRPSDGPPPRPRGG
jgi:very-short-patch-repair endonuclease